MTTAARRQPAWKILHTMAFLGPVRVAFIFAIMRTPWRFGTMRDRWPNAAGHALGAKEAARLLELTLAR